MNNKRGSIIEITSILWTLFGIAVMSLIMLTIINAVNDDFQADPSIDALSKSIIASGASQAPAIYDFWFMILFIGIPLIAAVLAYFNNIHPLFFWISLGMVILIVIVGAGISQFWSDLTSDSLLGTQAALMPMMNFILSNFGLYSFFVFIIIAMGTFIKLRGTDQYGGFT